VASAVVESPLLWRVVDRESFVLKSLAQVFPVEPCDNQKTETYERNKSTLKT
jgi:hypothetical protein